MSPRAQTARIFSRASLLKVTWRLVRSSNCSSSNCRLGSISSGRDRNPGCVNVHKLIRASKSSLAHEFLDGLRPETNSRRKACLSHTRIGELACRRRSTFRRRMAKDYRCLPRSSCRARDASRLATRCFIAGSWRDASRPHEALRLPARRAVASARSQQLSHWPSRHDAFQSRSMAAQRWR
jgi:hypothetical protein